MPKSIFTYKKCAFEAATSKGAKQSDYLYYKRKDLKSQWIIAY